MCSPITGLVEDQPTPHGAPPKKEQVMRTYDLSRVSDAALVRKLTVLLAEERISMAAVLALLAEVDARRLYLPAGFPSMYAYCIGELHLCEQAAMKHIRAARTARRFPVIFSAVADGRLHLSAVVLLTPHLTSANAAELVAAAAYQTQAEGQQPLDLPPGLGRVRGYGVRSQEH